MRKTSKAKMVIGQPTTNKDDSGFNGRYADLNEAISKLKVDEWLPVTFEDESDIRSAIQNVYKVFNKGEWKNLPYAVSVHKEAIAQKIPSQPKEELESAMPEWPFRYR